MVFSSVQGGQDMRKNRMEERRKNQRFSIRLGGHYLRENGEEWKDCTVTNISRSGMGIIVYVHERIPIGSFLQIEIVVPKRVTRLMTRSTSFRSVILFKIISLQVLLL